MWPTNTKKNCKYLNFASDVCIETWEVNLRGYKNPATLSNVKNSLTLLMVYLIYFVTKILLCLSETCNYFLWKKIIPIIFMTGSKDWIVSVIKTLFVNLILYNSCGVRVCLYIQNQIAFTGTCNLLLNMYYKACYIMDRHIFYSWILRRSLFTTHLHQIIMLILNNAIQNILYWFINISSTKEYINVRLCNLVTLFRSWIVQYPFSQMPMSR